MAFMREYLLIWKKKRSYFIRPLSKLHLPAKTAIFFLIFIASPYRLIQVVSSMRSESATLPLKIGKKIFDFFGQSEFRKRSISFFLLLCAPLLDAQLPAPFRGLELPFQYQEKSFETLVLERREEIASLNKRWSDKLKASEHEAFFTLFAKGELRESSTGSGGTYILYDSEEVARYVIQPTDEDLLCLHNKAKASCLDNRAMRTRLHIPPYYSAQTKSLSYDLATLLHLQAVTPPTFLAILSHPLFFDCNDILQTPIGETTREKLCAVQSFWPDIDNLHDLAEKWLASGVTDESLLDLIYQESFEDLYLFIWLIYDTDAHAGNLFAQKGTDDRYLLCKLDNALSFPDHNTGLYNALFFLPNAHLLPSKRLKERLEGLCFEAINELFTFYERESAAKPFWQRVEKLKALLDDHTLNFRQIDQNLLQP